MLEHDPRLTLIRTWLTRDLGWRVGRISVASADASFRRYFRVSRGDVDPSGWAPKADTLVVMDAPPGKEDIAPVPEGVDTARAGRSARAPCARLGYAARLCRDGGSGEHPVPVAAQDRARRRQAVRRRPHNPRQHPGEGPARLSTTRAVRPRAAGTRVESHARVVPRQTPPARAHAGGARAVDGHQRVPDQRGAAAAAGVRAP